MCEKHGDRKARRQRGFALEPDEVYQDRKRIEIVTNDGDKDSLLYGNVDLDDRDRFEGFGVSALREDEIDGWTVNVADYERFSYLRRQEDALSEAEASLLSCQQEISMVEAQCVFAAPTYPWKTRLSRKGM